MTKANKKVGFQQESKNPSQIMMRSIRARKNKIKEAFVFGNCIASSYACVGLIIITSNYVFGLVSFLYLIYVKYVAGHFFSQGDIGNFGI